MGHIINKKKRGRPPKSDLATRPRDSDLESEPRARRSLRHQNVRYNFIDYDDFIDDDYFEEGEDEEEECEERRREKKVKLVMKLNQGSRDGHVSGSEDEEHEYMWRKMMRPRKHAGRGTMVSPAVGVPPSYPAPHRVRSGANIGQTRTNPPH